MSVGALSGGMWYAPLPEGERPKGRALDVLATSCSMGTDGSLARVSLHGTGVHIARAVGSRGGLAPFTSMKVASFPRGSLEFFAHNAQ
jgi:hypothetical protein